MKKLISLILIFSFLIPFVSSASFHNTLDINLISYWQLDASSGNASDSVGTNTFTNDNATYTSGKINNGADLEKDTSANFVSTVTPATGSGDKTVSCWIKPESFNVPGNICASFGGSSSNASTLIGLQQSGYPSAWLSGGLGEARSTVKIATSTWSHLVAVYKTSGILLYVNGVLVKTGASNSMNVSGTNANYFGNYADYDANWGFDGVIDEVGVWSRALTADEILTLYNEGVGFSYDQIYYEPLDDVTNADITFGLAIIIVLLFIIVLGFAFNNLHKKSINLPFK